MFRLAIFDLDGTLVKQKIDFRALKKEAGCPQECPFLEYVESLGPCQKKRALAILAEHEMKAAAEAQLNPGIAGLLELLKRKGINTGILTRNSRRPTLATLSRCGLSFDAVISREDGPPKPSPEAVLRLCKRFNVPPGRTVLTGDFDFDVISAKEAGATAIYVGMKTAFEKHKPDYSVKNTQELEPLFKRLLEKGR